MPPCNVVFGRTGCGKTSLKNMLCGQDPEEISLTSGTSDAAILKLDIDGKLYHYVDTAGILDNRGKKEDLKNHRAKKVNDIGGLLKKANLEVGRVLYCVAHSERLLQEEIDWLADIIQMLGGQKVMQCFAVVLTKVDQGFAAKKFKRDWDNMPLVQVLRSAFPNCPIVTSGYDNVQSVQDILVPASDTRAFVMKASDLKVVTPKETLETQIASTKAQLDSVMKMLAGAGTSREQLLQQNEALDQEIDSLTERIANAGWWCPGSEIEKAKSRIAECRALMRDLKCNSMKTDQDKARYEKQKVELLDMMKEAEKDLAEKTSLGSMFMTMLTEAKSVVGVAKASGVIG